MGSYWPNWCAEPACVSPWSKHTGQEVPRNGGFRPDAIGTIRSGIGHNGYLQVWAMPCLCFSMRHGRRKANILVRRYPEMVASCLKPLALLDRNLFFSTENGSIRNWTQWSLLSFELCMYWFTAFIYGVLHSKPDCSYSSCVACLEQRIKGRSWRVMGV